jgi:hypothetical protein
LWFFISLLSSGDRATWNKVKGKTSEMQLSWCLLVFTFSTCFRHHYAHRQEYNTECLPHMVFCACCAVVVLSSCGGICVHSTDVATQLRRGHTDSRPRLHNKCITPYAVNIQSCTPDDGHNDAWNILRKWTPININSAASHWFFLWLERKYVFCWALYKDTRLEPAAASFIFRREDREFYYEKKECGLLKTVYCHIPKSTTSNPFIPSAYRILMSFLHTYKHHLF